MIHYLDSSIAKYELPEDIKTYRAIKGKYINKDEKVYTDKAYMSTTLIFDVAETYAKEHDCDTILELVVSKGRGKCAYINEISVFRDEEYELLLKRNSRFTIKGIEKKGTLTIIKAVE